MSTFNNQNIGIFDTYYIIRNIETQKYITYITKTKDQLSIEICLEQMKSFYSNSLYCEHLSKAVKIYGFDNAEQMFSWFEELSPGKHELIKINVTGTKIS